MEFKYYVIIACSILGVFLVYKEISRINKSQLVWRLFASLVMVLSFSFLIIPITYTVRKEEPIHELNLITEGIVPDSLAKLTAQKYSLDFSLHSAKKGASVKFIEDLAYHLQEHPELKKVNIYGYGLKEKELSLLKNYKVSFHASAFPSGINSASWQKKIKATENLEVQGIYNNPTNQNVKLKFYGMGSTLDSAIIKANTKVKFSFNTQPKQMGKAVHQIIALQGNDTLAVESIPFEVTPKKQFRVLMLASFPDFEYKFLKKWLYENQYPVIFRSQISKDKYSSDFLNTKATDVNQIRASLLKQIDVLIMDEDEFSAITTAERSAIDAAVSEGMGLVMRLSNAKPNGSSQRFKRVEITSATAKTLQVNSIDHQLKLAELPFVQTLYLEPTPNEQPLFNASNGKTVVNSGLKGIGKVVVSSISSTYQWELSGEKTAYAKFWSAILANTGRKENATPSYELIPSFLTLAEEARLIVSVDDSKIPSLQFNQIELAPKQNMELPFKWDGKFWPLQAGWNKLSINQQTENIFVFKKADWKSLKNTEKLNATLNFVENQSSADLDLKKVEYSGEDELSKWWFFALFLLSASFLWYEQRFLQSK